MAVKQRINSADPETAEKFEIRIEEFIHHFVWGEPGTKGVGSHAVIAAGWSESHSASQACSLLRKPEIKTRIEEEFAEKRRQLKGKSALVAEKLFNEAVAGNVAAAVAFLRWTGELKDKVELSGGVTLEQLVPKRKLPTEGEH